MTLQRRTRSVGFVAKLTLIQQHFGVVFSRVMFTFSLDGFEQSSTLWARNAGGTCFFGGRHLSNVG